MRLVWLRHALIFGISVFLSGCLSFDGAGLLDRIGLGDKNSTDIESGSAPKSTGDGTENNRRERDTDDEHALQLGDKFTFDNPKTTWEITKISKGRIVWRTDSGEMHVTDINPILPALEWSGGKGGTGRRLIRDKIGSLFPMRVGAKTTFRSTVTSDRPPFGWENIWTCTVQGTETLKRLGRSFETFVVGCGRKRSNELTFNYAPEIGHYILQRTYQGAGKPKKLRNLIAYDRVKDRNVAALSTATPVAPLVKKAAPKAFAQKASAKKVLKLANQWTPPPGLKAEPKVAPKSPTVTTTPVDTTPTAATPAEEPKTVPTPAKPASPPAGTGGLAKLMESVTVQTPDFEADAVGAGTPTPFKPIPAKSKADTPDSAKPKIVTVKKPVKKSVRRPVPAAPLSIKKDSELTKRRRIPVPKFSPSKKRKPPLTAPPLKKAAVPPLPIPSLPIPSPPAPSPPVPSLKSAPPPVPPAPKVVAAKSSVTAALASKAPSNSVRYGVHLASYRTEAMALRGWRIELTDIFGDGVVRRRFGYGDFAVRHRH
jgi:hypothetical protein